MGFTCSVCRDINPFIMKNFLLILFCLGSLGHVLYAQDPGAARGTALNVDVIEAFYQGDTDALEGYINNQTDLWYKSQLRAGAAETILFALKNFFSEHPCRGLKMLNESKVQGVSIVKTRYTTSAGAVFNITFFIHKNTFKRLRIEKV